MATSERPTSRLGDIVGAAMDRVGFSSPYNDVYAREAAERRVDHARERFSEIPFSALEARTVAGMRLLVDTRDGSTWHLPSGVPGMGWEAARHRITVVDGEPRWLQPAVDAFGDRAPRTLAALEQLAKDIADREAEDRARVEREREERRRTAPVVTLCDLRKGSPDSLRAAVEELHGLGGRAAIVNGRLVVYLHPDRLGTIGWTAGAMQRGNAVVEALYLAEAALIAANKGKDGDVDPRQVPDRPLLPNGASAP